MIKLWTHRSAGTGRSGRKHGHLLLRHRRHTTSHQLKHRVANLRPPSLPTNLVSRLGRGRGLALAEPLLHVRLPRLPPDNGVGRVGQLLRQLVLWRRGWDARGGALSAPSNQPVHRRLTGGVRAGLPHTPGARAGGPPLRCHPAYRQACGSASSLTSIAHLALAGLLREALLSQISLGEAAAVSGAVAREARLQPAVVHALSDLHRAGNSREWAG